MHSQRTWSAWLGVVVIGVLVAGQGRSRAQGQFNPLTDADVIALKLNHYFTADKTAHQADFEWTFTKKGFVLKDGTGKIPADLLEKLLPEGTSASEIRGEWKLETKDGQRLVLSSIKADGKAGKLDVSLPIHRTAPIVARIGDPQYVFGVGR